ncbi:MAG: hypothetical protein IPM54_43265 [Polyangiaceae bacterium]|nr:hypothetical protein [Polyangiaceae bacterium]
MVAAEPGAEKYIRAYMSGGNFIDGVTRYCLWLKDADPRELKKLTLVWDRVENVKKFREASTAASTRAYAKYPTLFRQIAQPNSDYLAIPEVSSERRAYIPIGFISQDVTVPKSFRVLLLARSTGWSFFLVVVLATPSR